MAQGLFYDGQTARPRQASLAFSAEAIDIAEGGVVLARWPYDQVRLLEAASEETLRLALAHPGSLARLEVSEPQARADVLARCPALGEGRDQGRAGPIVAWSLAAAASLIASVVFSVPIVADYAAPLVPVSWERRLGQAVDKQLRLVYGGDTCTKPEGRAALDRLVAGLTGRSSPRIEPDVIVLDSGFANAAALPGGRIYLFRGLIDEAESADEIAAVLAHEIGHVERRDSLRGLIQTSGASFLLGLLFGDVAGSGTLILLGNIAVDGVYSRDAERAADRFAADAMVALGRPPRALGAILDRIAPDDGPIPPFLSSHPVTKERLEALPEVAGPLGAPLLSPAEWEALKSVCKSG